VVDCDEYWDAEFTDGGWSAEDDFAFPYEGMWSVSAYLMNSSRQVLAYDGAGGGVVP